MLSLVYVIIIILTITITSTTILTIIIIPTIGRLTAMVGWSATTDFQEKWVFDATAEKYALDEKMADRLKELNPEAFRNILKRLLEASGRGYWAASDETLLKLQELYEDAEDEIEGIN